MKGIIRLILNFFIIGTLIILFSAMGWINFENLPVFVQQETLNYMIAGGIIGLNMLIIGEILESIYKVAKFATLGFAKIAYPVYFIVAGYLKIMIPGIYLQGWYTNVYSLLPILIMSVAIGLVKIPSPKK